MYPVLNRSTQHVLISRYICTSVSVTYHPFTCRTHSMSLTHDCTHPIPVPTRSCSSVSYLLPMSQSSPLHTTIRQTQTSAIRLNSHTYTHTHADTHKHTHIHTYTYTHVSSHHPPDLTTHHALPYPVEPLHVSVRLHYRLRDPRPAHIQPSQTHHPRECHVHLVGVGR